MRTVARAYRIKTMPYPAYIEEIADFAEEERTIGAIVDSRGSSTACENIAHLSDTTEQRRPMSEVKKRNVKHEKIWLRRLSPWYYIQRILRFCLREKEDALFWTMDADQYRLCIEHAECIKPARAKIVMDCEGRG